MNAEGAERRRERNAERGKRGGVGWGGSKVIFLLVNVVRLPGPTKLEDCFSVGRIRENTLD